MAYSFAFLLTSLLILPAAFGQCVDVEVGGSTASRERYGLLLGDSLKRGDVLLGGNKYCKLLLEDDCTLSLYDSRESPDAQLKWKAGNAVSNSFLSPKPNCELKMEYKSSGNLVLVVYYYEDNQNTRKLWESAIIKITDPYPVFILESVDINVECHLAPGFGSASIAVKYYM